MITQYRPAYYDNPRASTLSGLSTDPKPTDVENGARYEEIDTGKTFCFDKENKAWYEMPQSGGGGSSVSVEPITITKNGVTTAPDGVAYSPITTNVPTPVTSVNGKTGDVKTGMVVNFTMSTNGTLSSDVPFADVLSFIQGFADFPPSITAKTIDADNEPNNYIFTQYQIVSSSGGENQIIFFDGKSLKTTLTGLPGMLIWSNNKATLFYYPTAYSVVLDCQEVDGVWVVNPFLPSDNSAFSAFDGGVMELMGLAVAYGHYPAMLVFVGDDIIPAYFSGIFGESIVFRSPELNGTVKVITGTAGESDISWVVTEESASVLIVDYNPDNGTANKSFDEIRNAMANDIPVFLHFQSRLFPSSNTDFGDDSHITFELISMDKTGYTSFYMTVTSNNTWSVGITNHKFQYRSPGGKYFEIEVSDDGTLSTVEVTT